MFLRECVILRCEDVQLNLIKIVKCLNCLNCIRLCLAVRMERSKGLDLVRLLRMTGQSNLTQRCFINKIKP